MTHRRKRGIMVLALAISVAGCQDEESATGIDVDPTVDTQVAELRGRGFQGITVLSRNVYLGGDLAPILGASSPEQIPVLAGQTWAQIVSTDFPARAEALAREIARTHPHVVGLQEVALFRTQSPGDFLVGNPEPAATVVFDYLEILMDALARRGLHYDVAASNENSDIELPALTSPTSLDDVRWTDHDVVLVRQDVTVLDASSANYAINVSVPVEIKRGYNRVDVEVRGNRFQIVNTHLESDETSEAVQQAQAAELVGLLGGESVPAIVLGDLNFVPNAGTAAEQLLEEAGFEDVWEQLPGPSSRTGFTCCFSKDLTDGSLFERIDYVLVRDGESTELAVAGGRITGRFKTARTDDGRIYASDHAGVFARLRIRQPFHR